jgi:hypothetical protein
MENKDHKLCIKALEESQAADTDIREQVREAKLFLNKRDGQWEPTWWSQNVGNPRYTFDQANPVVDQIAGALEKADFDIKIRPAGGNASKEVAKVYDGLVRNIENISNAKATFNAAGREMVGCGLDGWRVVQKYTDGDSFDQDLVIERINNFVDRVWFDVGSEMQDRSDARRCWVMQSIPKDDYQERWPKGTALSVGVDRVNSAYWNKAETVIVGEYYYIEQETRDLVLMSNGSVLEDNEDFQKIFDELAAAGVEEVKRRSRAKDVVYIRQFDAGGWLSKPRKTVFKHIPVIPTYANFKIIENKPIYWGVVEKIIDACRVFNYSMSREVGEGALSPRAKYWMTRTQAAGEEDTIATLNTNADPVQFFNPDPANPGVPQQNGGAQINPGLSRTSEAMRGIIGGVSGMFAASMGDNPGLQSGIAIEKLQEKGHVGVIKYFAAQEIAIRHTARIIVDAIPPIYGVDDRMVRILNEDGSFEMQKMNEKVVDQQTGEVITLNNLAEGSFDVVCSAGASFQNRQQETVAALLEVGQVDPSIIQQNGDILMNNLNAPGMDQIAERKRAQLLQQGMIPESQMTDEEKQAAQQAAQQAQQQPDPMALAAQAEIMKAQAEMAKVEANKENNMLNAQLKQADQQIQMMKLQQSGQKDGISAQQKQQSFDLSIEKMRQDLLLQMQEQRRKTEETEINMQKMQAETLKVLREAMGIDAIVSPAGVKVYNEQIGEIDKSI